MQIPPRPASFTPDGAPPGITVQFDAFRDPAGRPWYLSRPKIVPRVAIVHTNAARSEGSTQSQINWGNAAAGNTKPHYALNAPTPVKLVPTDRRAIANSTEDAFQAAQGEQDCSFWTIAIETADTGTIADPAVSDFLTVSRHGPVPVPHAELVARILAYESIVWGFPLALPHRWNGVGVAAHTFPFPYPAYTIHRGKTCPGPKKIRSLLEQIIPRAIEIRQAWTTPVTPPEIIPPIGDMMGLELILVDDTRARVLDTRKPATPAAGGNAGAKLAAGAHITVPAHRAGLPANTRAVAVTATAVDVDGAGFLTAWASGDRPEKSFLNYTTPGTTIAGFTIVPLSGFGTFELATGGPASGSHVVVDVVAAFVEATPPA